MILFMMLSCLEFIGQRLMSRLPHPLGRSRL